MSTAPRKRRRRIYAPTAAKKQGWRRERDGFWRHADWLTAYASAKDALAAQKRSNSAQY